MILPVLPACAAVEPPPSPLVASSHPLAGKAWRPATGDWLSPAEIAGVIAPAEAILLGETHDNPDHHALQSWVTRLLVRAGRRPVVAFEMVDRDRQGDLDSGSNDLAGLGGRVAWEARGWPDWAMYRPIAEAALAGGGRLAAVNLPAEATRMIARGAEPPALTERLGLDRPLADADQAALAEEIRLSHCGLMPDSAIPAMTRVQRARDAEMAAGMAAQASSVAAPVVLIAGAGHVRADRGVPARLREIAPDLLVVSVGFVEVEAGLDDPAAYAGRFGAAAMPFDVVWFTGRIDREDPCARIERHLRDRTGRPQG